ncbi:39S ribosomal protein L27, mitochondrial isoform X1 [Manis pentadactyla]|uniref:39S ribosomal protein L27, mitochondrial isoform X1 n=1 Tax=Manis pentadactyla TaxID=143292 RepID=UPI00255CB5AC|nr:39S ribosomal protein L27, mitochondrial isoform X1 [Manis pentadactyla]KAI5128692.1 39S Ribosomal Protein L27 [Manis pentadactyla]
MASVVRALRTRAPVTALLSPPQAAALAVRYASKKTGGSSKNLGGKSPGKHFGIKKMDGHYVHAGNILATQRHFRWHPGAHGPESSEDYPEALGWTTWLGVRLISSVLQVGLGKKKHLCALEEGVVRYTKEVYVPSPNNSEAMDLVTSLPKGAVLYKTFVHVVPAKPEGTFKLVAML